MIRAVDSSVIIAAFATWHADHPAAKRVLARKPIAVGHALVETFSVLTRLPQPQRAEPPTIADFLDANFAGPALALSPDEVRLIPRKLVDLGISGGAAYDAVIALTVAAVGATLVSLDLRAAATYRRCGVNVEYLNAADVAAAASDAQ